ncbi:hypothetical protein BKA61DRAFT_574540 [Leptodontidium sp. MPI-SDFR-AT-0119]|nr:hypothetical protein BKA61DRAFT_574540 [Leptodontidium sp. MPI-SDFR-AT-0119]
MTTPTAAAPQPPPWPSALKPKLSREILDTATDPNTSIEDAIQTFELLTLELPDSNQHLVEQNLGHPLMTFTCFPKLPLELRLIVWMYVLPGRRVVDLTTRIVRRGPRRSLPGLPIGLFINQESRRQALKFYTIFTQEHHSLRNWNSKPFALDPDVDLVRINARYAFGDFPH